MRIEQKATPIEMGSIKFEDLELDKLYSISKELEPIVSPTGRALIEEYIGKNITDEIYSSNSIEAFVNAAIRTIGNEVSTSNGSYAKRLARELWLGWRIKTPKSIVREVGNIADQHKIITTNMGFDITKTLDWGPSEFGQRESCFFTGGHYGQVKDLMPDYDMGAWRWWEQLPDDTWKDYGRIWYLERPKYIGLLNSYQLTASQAASTIGEILGAEPIKVGVRQARNAGAFFYINRATKWIIPRVEGHTQKTVTLPTFRPRFRRRSPDGLHVLTQGRRYLVRGGDSFVSTHSRFGGDAQVMLRYFEGNEYTAIWMGDHFQMIVTDPVQREGTWNIALDDVEIIGEEQ